MTHHEVRRPAARPFDGVAWAGGRLPALRGIAARGVAAAFAVGWLVFPGFGLIDLSVTWSAAWPEVLEAGWGLFATVIVGAAFALVAIRPGASAAALGQLVIATAALAVSAVVAQETRLLALAALLAVQTAIVAVLFRGGRSSGVSRPLLAVAAAGAVPWLAYALHMWALDRDDLADGDVTLGIDHYSVQGALGLSLAVLPLSAALRADRRPFVPACAAVAAFYLGLVSLAWPHTPGGLGRPWSAAAIVWSLALVAATLPARRPRATLAP